MSDTLFNLAMGFFIFLMAWVVKNPRIHTGILGGIGCAAMAIAALFAIDNSMYNSIEAVENCIMIFVGGCIAVVIHVVIAIHNAVDTSADLPADCPLRRRSDFSSLKD